MLGDIAIAILIICIPGMVHVLFPKQMARLYEKSYRDRAEAWGGTPGKVTLRPGLVLFFGLIWVAVGIWMIVNSVMQS